jgi:hypothetical protein
MFFFFHCSSSYFILVDFHCFYNLNQTFIFNHVAFWVNGLVNSLFFTSLVSLLLNFYIKLNLFNLIYLLKVGNFFIFNYTWPSFLNLHFFNTFLLNNLNLVHPPLLYLVIINLSQVFFKFYKFQYLTVLTYVSLLSLFLGSWWAEQEGTWGGWWAWDPSEVFGLAILLSYLIPIHLFSLSYYAGIIFNFLLCFCLIFIYYIIQYNFTLTSHNFGNSFFFFSSQHYLVYVLFLLVSIVSFTVSTYQLSLLTRLNGFIVLLFVISIILLVIIFSDFLPFVLNFNELFKYLEFFVFFSWYILFTRFFKITLFFFKEGLTLLFNFFIFFLKGFFLRHFLYFFVSGLVLMVYDSTLNFDVNWNCIGTSFTLIKLNNFYIFYYQQLLMFSLTTSLIYPISIIFLAIVFLFTKGYFFKGFSIFVLNYTFAFLNNVLIGFILFYILFIFLV